MVNLSYERVEFSADFEFRINFESPEMSIGPVNIPKLKILGACYSTKIRLNNNRFYLKG